LLAATELLGEKAVHQSIQDNMEEAICVIALMQIYQ
jgi:hypothetical protein